MPFDGLVTKSVISELKPILIDGKVNKITQPTKSEIIIEIFSKGNNYFLDLNIDPNLCHICLTTHQKKNPKNAYNFCMLLRKYLTGAKIIDVSNMDLERTIELKFQCYNELNDLVIRKLFIQIMSRQSNIILTNSSNVIIDCIKHFSSGDYEILPAHKFEFVPILRKSIINCTEEDFLKDIETTYNDDPAALYSNIIPNTYIGISKAFVINLLSTLQVDDTNICKESSQKIFIEIKNILDSISKNFISLIDLENDYTIEKSDNDQISINEYLDKFYFEKEAKLIYNTSKNNLLNIVSSQLKKESKKIENINNKLKECKKKETYKLYGELLTANLYKLENNDNSHLSTIELENYYDNNATIKIPLDNSVNIHGNIKKYYKKYTKLKNAEKIVLAQQNESLNTLQYLESLLYSINKSTSILDLNEIYQEITNNLNYKKGQTQIASTNIPKIEPIIYKGYSIYIGRNNLQNDYLTLHFAKKNDLWFHAQRIQGSHVILRISDINNNIIPDDVLALCAHLAKENSKAALSTGVFVDYCPIKNVRKQPGGKPGMVIYTDYKTIYIK